jgi:peptidoglycan lytic transglycosylase
MLENEKSTPGAVTRPRTAIAMIAATLLLGGTASEASAKSRHHHYRHHLHDNQAGNSENNFLSSFQSNFQNNFSWREAHASIAPSSGRSFSGMASYYGNESGSRTASGQRFNQNAMTAAHRTLPFGTRLRVTHGERSVVVTINDRGPFIRGRVLDLSKGAARAIGLPGVGRVVAEVI